MDAWPDMSCSVLDIEHDNVAENVAEKEPDLSCAICGAMVPGQFGFCTTCFHISESGAFFCDMTAEFQQVQTQRTSEDYEIRDTLAALQRARSVANADDVRRSVSQKNSPLLVPQLSVLIHLPKSVAGMESSLAACSVPMRKFCVESQCQGAIRRHRLGGFSL